MVCPMHWSQIHTRGICKELKTPESYLIKCRRFHNAICNVGGICTCRKLGAVTWAATGYVRPTAAC